MYGGGGGGGGGYGYAPSYASAGHGYPGGGGDGYHHHVEVPPHAWHPDGYSSGNQYHPEGQGWEAPGHRGPPHHSEAYNNGHARLHHSPRHPPPSSRSSWYGDGRARPSCSPSAGRRQRSLSAERDGGGKRRRADSPRRSASERGPVAAASTSSSRGRAEIPRAYVKLLEMELRRLRQLVPTAALREPKLLILDLNGFLVYRRRVGCTSTDQFKVTPTRPADRQDGGFHIWLRPRAKEFLDFLLSQYHVAVWSSATLRNIWPLLSALLGSEKEASDRLAFVWSQTECTDSGKGHPNDSHRPMFHKEIAKVFSDSSFGGLYHAKNTLLIDDDLSKVALNPPHLSIAPPKYAGANEEEDLSEKGRGGLASGGELWLWLAELLEAEDVPGYVGRHLWPPIEPPRPDPAEIQTGEEEEAESVSASGEGGAGPKGEGHGQ